MGIESKTKLPTIEEEIIKGMRFLTNIFVLDGQNPNTHPLVLVIDQYPVKYELEKKTNATYAVWVSNETYHKAVEFLESARQRKRRH